ncbi:MAG: GNAT family N-acetyltransferase [Woeseiaceae bacterium]|nr:GNAT family N-acetyltransferase [Woeseiaceae bacterium]
MDELGFRRIDAREFQWLYELVRDSFHDVVVRQLGNWDDDRERALFDRKWRDDNCVRIVLLGNVRIGAVRQEQRASYDWLDQILIAAEHRGKGYGTALVRSFVSDARARCRPLRLRVLHENHRARHFYERLGFVEVEKLDNHCLMQAE